MADKTESDQAGQGNDTGSTDGSSIEERLAKLEKTNADYEAALGEVRKESAGKDRRISEQDKTIKELQKTTLSKDELLAVREKELADKEVAIEAKNAAERQELEILRLKMVKQETLTGLNTPAVLWEFIEGTNKEELETRARKLMNIISKDIKLIDNARKVTGRPQTGDKKGESLTVQDIKEMNSRAAVDKISSMSREDQDRLFEESLQGK